MYKVNLYNLISKISYVAIWELILCGSGQIIHVTGNLTLRMALFIVIIISTIILVNRIKMTNEPRNLFLSYVVLLLIGIAISFINGNMIYLFEDIKPQLYILIFPFMYLAVSSQNNIGVISRIICLGSLIMAIIYLIYLLVIKVLGMIPFQILYSSMNTESDIMFRGDKGELFYKGFVFLPVGLIFYLHKKKYIPVCIILLAIYFTLTRGFYIITLAGILIYMIIYPRFSWRRFIFAIFGLVFIYIFILFIDITAVVGAREDSDLIRIVTFKQVMERLSIGTVWLGYGLGNGVPIRPIHMECSYLEILHKQGIVGLMYWFVFLICIINAYRKCSRESKSMAVPYLIGIFMIYIQSIFNPYLSNPIGLSLIMIGYLAIYFLSKIHESTYCNRSFPRNVR